MNLTEKSPNNRKKIYNMKLPHTDSSVEPPSTQELGVLAILTRVFVQHEASARVVDEELDNELLEEVPEDADEQAASEQDALQRLRNDLNEDDMATALNSAMQKAHAHMQDSMLASYLAMFISCLIQEDRGLAAEARAHIPGANFDTMIEQLERFQEYAELTVSAILSAEQRT